MKMTKDEIYSILKMAAGFNYYEDAMEAAIKYYLENLI